MYRAVRTLLSSFLACTKALVSRQPKFIFLGYSTLFSPAMSILVDFWEALVFKWLAVVYSCCLVFTYNNSSEELCKILVRSRCKLYYLNVSSSGWCLFESNMLLSIESLSTRTSNPAYSILLSKNFNVVCAVWRFCLASLSFCLCTDPSTSYCFSMD